MTWLWGSVLVLLLALVGFVVGGMLGASTVPDGAGFEGGATVFVWGLASAVLLALLGVMLVRRAIARRQ